MQCRDFVRGIPADHVQDGLVPSGVIGQPSIDLEDLIPQDDNFSSVSNEPLNLPPRPYTGFVCHIWRCCLLVAAAEQTSIVFNFGGGQIQEKYRVHYTEIESNELEMARRFLSQQRCFVRSTRAPDTR